LTTTSISIDKSYQNNISTTDSLQNLYREADLALDLRLHEQYYVVCRSKGMDGMYKFDGIVDKEYQFSLKEDK
jgi:hypothetical protein